MSRRLSVLVLLVSLVVGAFVLDAATEEDAATPVATTADDLAADGVVPVRADPGALSSTWFCAGGTADEEAFADHVIAVLNPAETSVRVTVTAFAGEVAPPPPNAEVDDDLDDPDDADDEEPADDEPADDDDAADEEPDAPDGEDPAAASTEPVTRVVEVAARSRLRLALTELVQAPIASALVEAGAGGIVVEHEVSSIHGSDAKPCATSAADEWHLAWGTTEREARELLVLFNPFPDDAIVEGRFATDEGVREPARFAGGLVVPARSTLAVDVGDDVTRRAEVAATLRTRTGRVVVDRIVRIDEDGGRRGLTVQTAVPEPQQAWIFADGLVDEDVSESFHVYNPGDAVAEVSIELVLDRPEENGIPEPIDLSLPPGAQATVDVGADGRVPAGVAHAAVVRSANGVPVVAERVLASRAEGRRGITVSTGTPLEAEEWWFASGATSGSSDEWLYLLNLDPRVLAEVEVLAVVGGQLVPVSELQDVVVEPGERAAIRLGERIQRDDLALLVRSTEPIVVERGLYRVGEDARGASNSVGIPSRAGLRLPGDPLDVELDVDLGDDDLLDDAPTGDGDDVPEAPDDVELPEGDETIEFDDPDAEAEDRGTGSSTTTGDAPDEGSTTTTTAGTPPAEGVPDTTP